jgi:uncharacterized membrane protein HdeD (DUF308 family)
MMDMLRGAVDEALARNWWAVGLRGLFSILFGVIALLLPTVTMLSLVIVFSAYMLVDGILAIVAAVRAVKRRERWVLLVLEGVLDLAAGALAFLWPGLTVLAFVLLVAVWALASGVSMAAAGFRLGKERGSGWLIAGGLVSILYGVLLIVTPLIGAVVLTWWLGAYAIVIGGLLIGFAAKLRALNEHPIHGTAVHA